MQEVLGNGLVLDGLQGSAAGIGTLAAEALTLETAGLAGPSCAEDLFSNWRVQTFMRRPTPGALADDAPERLERASRFGGQALDRGLRKKLEEAFGGGADFSRVRLHQDSAAKDAAQSISAQAYAAGNDVFFGRRLNLDDEKGQHLLAHELAHVVQHQEGKLRATGSGLQVSSPTDLAEQEAERTARRVTQSLGHIDDKARKAQQDSARKQDALAAAAEEAEATMQALVPEPEFTPLPGADPTALFDLETPLPYNAEGYDELPAPQQDEALVDHIDQLLGREVAPSETAQGHRAAEVPRGPARPMTSPTAAKLRSRPVASSSEVFEQLPENTPLEVREAPDRPGWLHATVKDGPLAGTSGWMPA